jgi:hypothetical protein
VNKDAISEEKHKVSSLKIKKSIAKKNKKSKFPLGPKLKLQVNICGKKLIRPD